MPTAVEVTPTIEPAAAMEATTAKSPAAVKCSAAKTASSSKSAPANAAATPAHIRHGVWRVTDTGQPGRRRSHRFDRPG